MANGHGGAREGGGRPLGSKSTNTLLREQALAEIGPWEGSMLDLLIMIARSEKYPASLRVDCAKTAIQYQHPKLSSVTTQEIKAQDRAEIKDQAESLTTAELHSILQRGKKAA